jgi:hypothetical protein
VRAIRRSIERFGFVGAVVVRNGVIAKGHATLEAAKQIYADGGAIYPPPGKKKGAEPLLLGSVPVQDATGWTEEEFRAFVIADNRIQEQSGWDRMLLSEELPLIEDEDLTALMGDLDLEKIVAPSYMQRGYDEGVVIQDYYAAPTEDGDGGGETEAEAPAAVPASGKYPVTFTLDADEWRRWLDVKAALPGVTQKKLFLEALEGKA